MPDYETVRAFTSTSSSKTYRVKRRLDTGALTCDCPVWVFNRNGDRTCYHTMRVWAESGVHPPAPVPGATLGASQPGIAPTARHGATAEPRRKLRL